MASAVIDGSIAMHDLHITDTFMNPSYITIGDPYKDPKPHICEDRTRGKQFTTNPVKAGRTDGQMIQRGYVPLASGTAYVDMSKLQRQEELKKTKKQISQRAFIPASPPKKAVGRGSWFGCISKPPEHQPETRSVQKLKGDIKPAPRNFLTSPPKRGSYGYRGTGIGKEYEWVSEPYGGDPAKLRKMGLGPKTREERQKSPKPFLATAHGNNDFDRSVYAEYTNKKSTSRTRSAPVRSRQVRHAQPWRGMNSTKPTINSFPEYFSGKEREITTPKTTKIWKPSGTNDLSVPQPSIACLPLKAQTTFNRSMRL
ncbi:putative protein of unknown function (DUF4586) [Blattamonas nauphoetae]|uniref:Cilia-and flagella-associated protein 96 n=1 Tax=Blattamonas nauphoetae TaxID=2049346 RepID=A0ABQ9Y0D0_9EUKA|nr:putative protein of unknown function (DUF4586) [Blattamonas nauphoetae]